MNGRQLEQRDQHAVDEPQPRPRRGRRGARAAPARRRCTASWPMTTEHSTMMAPTDRSMPAVRMTSVWAMPMMPMMVTCCRISDRLKGSKKRPPTSEAENDDAEQQHDGRNGRRVGVQEMLQPPQGRSRSHLELGDAARSCRAASRPRRAGRCRHGASFIARTRQRLLAARTRNRPAAPAAVAGSESSAFVARDQPQQSSGRLALSIDGHAGDRLVGDQLDAGVEEIEARRRLAASCRSWRILRPPRRPWPPSAAETASRSRRSRRP